MITNFTTERCDLDNLIYRTSLDITLVVKPKDFDIIRQEGFLVTNTLFPHYTFEVGEKGTVENRYLGRFKNRAKPNTTWEQCVIDSKLGDWFISQAPLWFWAKFFIIDERSKINFEENRNKSVTSLWIAQNA